MTVEKIKQAATALLFLSLSAAAAVSIRLALSSASLPTVRAGSPVAADCSLWTDGVLTCNAFNPADRPSNVATLVTFTCSASKDKTDIYRETVIAEQVPEQGWSSVVVNSEGYSRFHKGIQNQLDDKAQAITDLARQAGVALSDLTDAQRTMLHRTVFDVCELKVGPSHLTLTERHRDADLVAVLKNLLAK